MLIAAFVLRLCELMFNRMRSRLWRGNLCAGRKVCRYIIMISQSLHIFLWEFNFLSKKSEIKPPQLWINPIIDGKNYSRDGKSQHFSPLVSGLMAFPNPDLSHFHPTLTPLDWTNTRADIWGSHWHLSGFIYYQISGRLPLILQLEGDLFVEALLLILELKSCWILQQKWAKKHKKVIFAYNTKVSSAYSSIFTPIVWCFSCF